MRTPSWESSAGALAAFLNAATQTYMVDLFTLTLSGGAVVRYTSGDVPVTLNGHTFSMGPAIKRGQTKVSVGISVDTLSVTLAADPTVTINGTPLLKFIATGGLDAARLTLERAFAAAPGGAWVGTLPLFAGRVSDTNVSRYEAVLSVASDSELLNCMVPRNVYQPGCTNTLFDGACGLSKAANANVVTAGSVTSVDKTTFSTVLALKDGYYPMGFLVGVTGANAGVGRTVKSTTSGVPSTITTIQPWPAPVAIGDTFTGYPGCDKTQTTCLGKFSNLARFRGQPYVPAPETVL